MNNNKFSGIKGEILAVNYLKKNKYKIIATNFVTRVGEIDIIATKDKQLVVIEVKSRSSTAYGLPCEAVTTSKQRHIINSTQLFILQNKLHDVNVRFDVIEVLNGEINHIINAFTV